MKKIISLFKRKYPENCLVYDEVTEGAEWVVNGEGIATRKYDGNCVLIKNGLYFKRYEVKRGRKFPDNFIPADEIDKNTGKQVGWVPVISDKPGDKYYMLAFSKIYKDGTYEMCGPRVQKNPEKFKEHVLVSHGKFFLKNVPTTFEGLKIWLRKKDIEGIVWYHEDGRKVKIKKTDFGLKRK